MGYLVLPFHRGELSLKADEATADVISRTKWRKERKTQEIFK